MAGQRQKSPDSLIFQRGGRTRKLEVVAETTRPVPEPPQNLSQYAADVWNDYWSSSLSFAVNYEAHGERLRHWIRCVDERERLWPLLLAEPVVAGSMGQPVINPLVRRVEGLTRDIEKAEDAYGMTPLAAWRMQLTVTEAQRSANDLRRELLEQSKPTGNKPTVIDLDSLE